MKPAAQLSWFVERRGVTLASRDGAVCQSIPYPYAALWALVANGNYSPTYAATLMGLLMCADQPTAQREVAQTLAAWAQAGLIAGE